MSRKPKGNANAPWNNPEWRRHLKQLQANETDDTKLCSKCLEIKPLEEFQKQVGRKDRGPRCKECQKEWRRERYREGHLRSKRLQSLYGITLDEYEHILASQDNKCAICGSTDPGRNQGCLLLDHCHSSGVVRGILCHPCNSILGLAADNPDRLVAAAEYLRKHKPCP